MHLLRSIAIWPNLELKTRPKQFLYSLPLDIVLPGVSLEPTHVKLEKPFQPSIISGSKANLSKLDHLSKESPGLLFASKADAYLSEA